MSADLVVPAACRSAGPKQSVPKTMSLPPSSAAMKQNHLSLKDKTEYISDNSVENWLSDLRIYWVVTLKRNNLSFQTSFFASTNAFQVAKPTLREEHNTRHQFHSPFTMDLKARTCRTPFSTLCPCRSAPRPNQRRYFCGGKTLAPFIESGSEWWKEMALECSQYHLASICWSDMVPDLPKDCTIGLSL